MKRKVKKYAGGTLVDSSGNPVRSSSGEPVRTRYGKDDDDRPMSSGTEDYASMGKRAGAVSMMSGAPTIKEETTTETETPTAPSARAFDEESVAGKGARNLALEEPEEEVNVKKTVIKKKKPKPKYEDTGAKIGSQDFRMKSLVPESTSGFGPKLSFLTKERLEKSREAMRSARGMKAGGSASSRGDGIAQRGKTKGRIC